MAKILLVVLLALFAGVYFAYEKQTATIAPKDVVTRGIEIARSKKPLSKSDEEVIKLQIALTDYMARQQRPPEKLADLVPTYFDAVPKNPDTGQPFKYERKGGSYSLELPGGKAPVATSEETGPSDIPLNIDAAKLAESGEYINPNTIETESVVYDPTDKRDPFKKFDFSAKEDDGVFRTPLERYSLAQLRLTAVIMDPKSSSATAFVEDAAGKGYPVRVGAKIGDKNGVIIDIQPNHMKILEKSVDFAGKETEQVTEMKIQTQGGAAGEVVEDDPKRRKKRK